MSNQYEGVVYGLLPKEEKKKLTDSSKTIQEFVGEMTGWQDCEYGIWSHNKAYREKPEPKPKKLVPWSIEDYKEPLMVSPRNSEGNVVKDSWCLIDRVTVDSVYLGGWGSVTHKALLLDYVQYPSGDPCGKEVEDDSK